MIFFGPLLLLSAFCLGAFYVPSTQAVPADDPGAWTVSGALTVDPNRPGPDGKPSLKLEPNGKAVLKLRPQDGSGKLALFVYDDGTIAGPGGMRAAGPRWGFTQANGRCFVAGIMYAPYLGENGSYCLIDSDGRDWYQLQYAGARAEPGWKKWEFVFSPEEGLTVSVDGNPVKKFDWNRTQAAGFDGLVLFGDAAQGGAAQSLWVSGIDYALGDPMKVQPHPGTQAAAAPPDVVPPADPREELRITTANTARLSSHPRLLLTPDSLPGLRAFYSSDAGKFWRDKMEAVLPSCIPPASPTFLTDATDGQRQGLWRLPTVALHYLLVGDKPSFERSVAFLKMLDDLPLWETGDEPNNGMSTANLMIGAALAYDWLYNDLDPAFRDKFGKTLLYHARAFYYGGHLMKTPGVHYWQNDPLNNHRWHNDAGVALALLASYGGSPEENWILNRTVEDLEFIAKWLPEDGSDHESLAYMIFGVSHLTLAFQAADECLGTRLLDAPFFQAMGTFRLQMTLSSFDGVLDFGDHSGNGNGYYNHAFLKAAVDHRQNDILNGLHKLEAAQPQSFNMAWLGLLWDGPERGGGDYRNLPREGFFPDIGVATFRDTWEPGGVAALFKSSPPGGASLNRYRNENQFKYVNVGHDDPDANSFILFIGDDLLACDDPYSAHKRSSQQNTILVNGLGQTPPGRTDDGPVYAQPGRGDMTQMARIVSRWNKGGISVVEGEAAGSYPAVEAPKTGKSQGRPALQRYRRLFIWAPGQYVLVLDDIESDGEVSVTWLVQGPDLQKDDAKPGFFQLLGKKESCGFQVEGDRGLQFEIVGSTADDHGKAMGYRQLRADATGRGLRIAGLFNPWKKEGLTLNLRPISNRTAEVAISGGGVDSRFLWTLAPDAASPSGLDPMPAPSQVPR